MEGLHRLSRRTELHVVLYLLNVGFVLFDQGRFVSGSLPEIGGTVSVGFL